MKQKILLTLLIASISVSVSAQKSTAYAITASQKGGSSWTEVKLVDLTTGDEVKSIYASKDDPQIFNARTGKAIEKKNNDNVSQTKVSVYTMPGGNEIKSNDNSTTPQAIRTIINAKVNTNINTSVNTNINTHVRTFIIVSSPDKPFSTKSAALAYDKKHERLYYTPMGINQLRYIDLKSGKIFYFEDEPLGVLSGPGDISNQIPRMVTGSDGNVYALTNNGNHLIRITTNKKAEITDLGALTDDASNGNYSVHSPSGYGGDIVAAKSGELYLITANHVVFKIDMKTMTATSKGAIQGLPRGFSTNGAAVEEGTKIIVASSNSTEGYFRFDINTMSAEKVSNSGSVYNASDLANGNLITVDKKKKEDPKVEPEPEVKPDEPSASKANPAENAIVSENKISIYPNPVTSGQFKLSFNNYVAGKYQVQVMDIEGKTIYSQSVTINYKSQVSDVKLPSLTAKGNYFVKVVDENNKVINLDKLIVQ